MKRFTDISRTDLGIINLEVDILLER
jgi:hypothetical protein